jgi:hypothetical protein
LQLTLPPFFHALLLLLLLLLGLFLLLLPHSQHAAVSHYLLLPLSTWMRFSAGWKNRWMIEQLLFIVFV